MRWASFLSLAGPHLFSRRRGPTPSAKAQGCRSHALGGAASPRFPPAGHPNAAAALGTPALALAAGAVMLTGPLYSNPFVLGSMRASRRSFAQATRSARANALKTASI